MKRAIVNILYFFLGIFTSILFFSSAVAVLFCNSTYVAIYVIIVMIIAPLLAIVSPIILCIKCWKRRKSYSIGIIAGMVFLSIAAVTLVIQTIPFLHH